MTWWRVILVLFMCVVCNADPYGQASIIKWLPWGPDAQRRRNKRNK